MKLQDLHVGPKLDALPQLYVDGGGDPTGEGEPPYYSVARVHGDGEVEFWKKREVCLRYETHQEAEHRAILEALVGVEKRELPGAVIHSDAQVPVRQVLGKYRCNVTRIYAILKMSREIFQRLHDEGVYVHIRWVPREEIEPILGH